MKTFSKQLVISILGILAGIAAWPLIEYLIFKQVLFPSHLVYSIVSGAVFGLVLGAFFATAEGIISAVPARIFRALPLGILLGAVGGALGMLAAQALLFPVGKLVLMSAERLQWIGFPLTRALGWGVLGIFVGMSDGIRFRSPRRIGIGALGGCIGGFAGGLTLEYLKVFFPRLVLSRLAGLALFGFLMALIYALAERRFSRGTLRVLNGKMKGKLFFLNQNHTVLGSGRQADIVLQGYKNIEVKHAELLYRDRRMFLLPVEEAKTIINDEKTRERELKYEDVIQLGSCKLYYRHD